MGERKNPATPERSTTRRQMIASITIAFGTLAVSKIWAESPRQTMKETPGSAANRTRTSLHEDIDMKAGAQRIYEVLLDAKQFAAFTGVPADIDPKEGGLFSMFGGQIVGRTIELVPNQRIVQAWRPTHWDPGIYSIVKFELKAQSAGTGTSIALDHTGFPEGDFDHLEWGWHEHYWKPLEKYLT